MLLILVGADRGLLAGRSTVRITVEVRHYFSSTKTSKSTRGPTRPLIQLVPGLSREYSGRNVILVTYTWCQRARVKNEWRHTSAPPIRLCGVDREILTVIILHYLFIYTCFILYYIIYLYLFYVFVCARGVSVCACVCVEERALAVQLTFRISRAVEAGAQTARGCVRATTP